MAVKLAGSIAVCFNARRHSKELPAKVIARDGAATTVGDLKAYCLDKGPAYSHPRFVDIVAALPLNGAGKIDRGVVQAKLNKYRGAMGGVTVQAIFAADVNDDYVPQGDGSDLGLHSASLLAEVVQ